MSAIARIEGLLADGCYKLVSVLDRRDDQLILGRVHHATYAQIDHICRPEAGEYERVWVELKTPEEQAWARRHVEGGPQSDADAPSGEGEAAGPSGDLLSGEGDALGPGGPLGR